MDIKSFTTGLNEAQLEAVTYCDGPSLVIAGAGSGKTRVLTYKIAYLLRMGYEPRSILALTFTNKAAKEMNQRIASLGDDIDLRGLWSGTFHSLFARLLRIEHEFIGYPRDFTIYDTTDSRSLLKQIVKDLKLDEKNYKPSVVAHKISEAKNHLLLPKAYKADASIFQRDVNDHLEAVARIYEVYQQRLRAANAMDFDDLLLQTFLLLRDNREVKEKYQQRFRYILVDEYQDTNMAQHSILALLTGGGAKICVVGDDAQSIYGFRGADIQNILRFHQEYPSAKLIKLECNYRSTRQIVGAANSIINHNLHQIPKTVYSSCGDGEAVRIFQAGNDKEEAEQVVLRIVRYVRRKQIPYHEIAVLYRTNAQSRVLEEALQRHGMPYRIYGGLSFYQRKEIKDVVAYFRLAINPTDDEAFRRVINYPARGIGQTSLQRLQVGAAAAGLSLWETVHDIERYAPDITVAPRKKFEKFAAMIQDFVNRQTMMTASELAKYILHASGIFADLAASRDVEAVTRRENVDELLSAILTFEKDQLEERGGNFSEPVATDLRRDAPTAESSDCKIVIPLSTYLSTVSLLSETDTKDDGTSRVTLMTVHAAKGLEFEVVFVTGMEDDLFPGCNARLYPGEMEEERRLFYVAVTRAKRFCVLSYSRQRFHYGSIQYSGSVFLSEIDERYLEREDHAARKGHSSSNFLREETIRRREPSDFFGSASDMQQLSSRFKRVTPSLVSSLNNGDRSSHTTTNPTYSIGQHIVHERFGEGVIQGVEGEGNNEKIVVDFKRVGEKTLLVKFAKIMIK